MTSLNVNRREGAPQLLPTAMQWERTSAQSGLLDWALDEMLLDDPIVARSIVWDGPAACVAVPAVASMGLAHMGAFAKTATNECSCHEPPSDSDASEASDAEEEDESKGAAEAPRARGAPVHTHIRGKLTSHHAVAIFLVKLRPKQGFKAAEKLAAEFGVTAKAIRDVWARKSWATQTLPYWELTSLEAMPLATFGSASSDARVASALCKGVGL